jgi:hypothetical protein
MLLLSHQLHIEVMNDEPRHIARQVLRYLGCAAPSNCVALACICCAVSLGTSSLLHSYARDLR